MLLTHQEKLLLTNDWSGTLRIRQCRNLSTDPELPREKRGLVHIFRASATKREDSLPENVYLSPLFASSRQLPYPPAATPVGYCPSIHKQYHGG